VLNF
jgi:acyl carrier protein